MQADFAVDQQRIKTGGCRIAGGRAQVEQQFLAGDIEQIDSRDRAVQIGDQAMNAAPGGFQRLERRMMQQRAHLFADCGIHRGDPGRLTRVGVDDVRLDDSLQQRVDGGRSRLGRSRRGVAGRLPQQAFEQSGVGFHGGGWFGLGRFRRRRRGAEFGDRLSETGRIEQTGAGAAQGLEYLQALIEGIGMKIVEPRKADRQGRATRFGAQRQSQFRRQSGHDRVQVIHVDGQQRAAGQVHHDVGRFPLAAATEIGHEQNPQRYPRIAAGCGRDGHGQSELEFHSAWHGAGSPGR